MLALFRVNELSCLLRRPIAALTIHALVTHDVQHVIKRSQARGLDLRLACGIVGAVANRLGNSFRIKREGRKPQGVIGKVAAALSSSGPAKDPPV
jgi:hypothetical protein